MRAVLILAFCAPFAAAAPAPEGKDDPAAKKELFAKEDWYKDQKGDEESFVGELKKKKGGGGIGIVQRFNPYQLLTTETVKTIVEENLNGVITKKIVPETRTVARDIYVGGKTDILDGYVGKKVKLTGKAVMMELEGTKFNEIWPAAIELVKDDKKADPKKDGKEVDVSDKLYSKEPGAEKEYVGVFKKDAKGGYRIVMKRGDEEQVENVYVSEDKADAFAPFVDKKIRLKGKLVAGAAGFNTFSHILPGSITVLDADEAPKKGEKKVDDKADSGTEVKILGRGAWRPVTKSGDQQQVVIRNGEELAKAAGLEKPDGDDAQKKAAETVAKALKVDDIDWKKLMLIVVTGGVKRTGGYSVEITKIETADKVMTVHWKLNSPKPGSPVTQAITHPALTVIVERFEGKVVFDPPAAKDGDKEK